MNKNYLNQIIKVLKNLFKKLHQPYYLFLKNPLDQIDIIDLMINAYKN